MRFSTAWADVLNQNLTLRIALVLLSVVTITLGISSARLALKEPLVIDRGCFASATEVGSPERTETEIKAFVEKAIQQRFNSSNNEVNFLKADQINHRIKEQEQLTQKNMRQTVVVNSVTVSKEGIVAEADRLISVGKIRSAFILPLQVQIESTTRSRSNPFGLVLADVKELKERSKDEKN